MSYAVIPLLLFFPLLTYGWDNLDYGSPSTNDNCVIIDREGYASCFDYTHGQPRWVSYRLTRQEVQEGASASRYGNFKKDSNISKQNSVSVDDYRKSGYDMGHLAPAADMKFTKATSSDSYFLSNISPQDPHFNRVTWRRLEAWCRDRALEEGSLFIFSGPVFGNSSTNVIGTHKITVPEAFFKVVHSENPTNRWTRGFLLPNSTYTNGFEGFACPMEAIERKAGLNFGILRNHTF